ncbi:MAG: choice-of-anchor Q domain-containing protein [Pirellulales bacterium]
MSTFSGPAWHRARIEPLESRSLLTASVIAVDTFDDVLNPNDGLTSLREAILAANASAGSDEIQLAVGTYALSIKGADEDAALRGDLDIVNNGSVKILGAGAATTTIDAAGLTIVPGSGDRLFDVQAHAVLEFEGLTLTGGSAPLSGAFTSVVGGAIRNTGGQVIVTGSTLSGNSANASGGGIYNTGNGQVTITDSTVSCNSAGYGGGIYNSGNGQVTITDSTLSGNTARDNGGAILSYNGGPVTIADSTLSGNAADDNGGAIYSSNRGPVTITGSSLSDNSAAMVGGAIYNGSQLTIIGGTLTGNSAVWGGGIHNTFGGQITITGSTLSDNTASDRGGAIHNSNGLQLTITDSTLSDNTARTGGGIYNQSNGETTIVDSTLSGNTANSDGGGIFNVGAGSLLEITGSALSENAAGYGGGIYNANSGQVTITDSTLSDSTADTGGGGIFNAGSGQVTIDGSTLSANTANSDGGGIFNATSGTVTLTNSTLSGNAANSFGGGIYNVYAGSQVTVHHSTITGNRADADGNGFGAGGGLYQAGGTTAVLDHTIVAGNFRKPALYNTASDIELDTPGLINAASSYNLVGDPATAGGLTHGINGNIVGNGLGNRLPAILILDTTLADNGGPTLTHALVTDSPALNAGDPIFDPNAFNPPLLYDQRGPGFPRVNDGRIDIGAYEGLANPLPVGGVIVVDLFEDSRAADGLWSLREAVIYTNTHPGDFEIQLAAGTYALTIQGDDENAALTGDLDILGNGSITIVGAGAATTTIDASGLVEGDQSDRIFDVHNAMLRLEGLTLTGGAAGLFGGAILISGGQVTITDCNLSNNFAAAGGAISTWPGGGHVTITDCTLSTNSAAAGGAIFNGANGQITISDSMISENVGLPVDGAGGAIYNLGEMTITRSTLSGNLGRAGGAIYNDDGQVTVTDSTVSGNTSYTGGAISGGGELTITRSSVSNNSGAAGIAHGGSATITDSIVSDNSGRGIVNFYGSTTVTGSTVSGNTLGGISNRGSMTIIGSLVSDNVSERDGGGIYNSGSATIINSTVSGNSANDNGGGIYSRAQITVRHSTIAGNRANADGNNSGLGGGLFLFTGSTATLEHTIVAGNVRGTAPGGTASDIEVGGGQVDPASSYNLIGDPNTAGGLVHGTDGNIVGDGNGNLLDINDVLDTTLSDNGGLTLTHALVENSPAINAGDPNFAPPPDYDQRGAGYARVVGGRIDIGAFEFGAEFQPVVVGRYIFYDDSIFDGNVPGINGGDNDAIASDKSALLADSSLAGPANITSYSRGINGIMVDIAGSHPDITAADFTFSMGSNNSPGSWAAAPEPLAVSVLAGQGLGGSDRVEIVWADGVIKNTYLQVIVAANDITGLAAPDVFFFGNRIGDTFTNSSPTTFITGAVDQIEVRGATPAFDLPVTSVLDFDKNGLLDANDQIVSRGNTGFLARIQISAPPAPLRRENESSGSGSDLDAVAVALATPVGDGDAGTAQPLGVAPSAAAPATSAARVDQALAANWSFLDDAHDEPPDDDDADELALILLGDDWRPAGNSS